MKETSNSYRANKKHLEIRTAETSVHKYSIQYMQINDNMKFSVFIYFQKNGGGGIVLTRVWNGQMLEKDNLLYYQIYHKSSQNDV